MSRGWKIALVVILSSVVVIGALVAVLAVFVFKAVKQPVDATNRYIEAINNGNAQEAWELLSPDSRIRQENTFNSFQQDLVQPYKGSLSGWNAHEVSISGSGAEVTVDMNFADGEKTEFTFELKKINDRWLIYDYHL